jgi:hypothetical protein
MIGLSALGVVMFWGAVVLAAMVVLWFLAVGLIAIVRHILGRRRSPRPLNVSLRRDA